MVKKQKRSGTVVPIEALMPHKVSELICIECRRRWIDVRPASVPLKDLECPNGHIGFVIETGEDIEEYE